MTKRFIRNPHTNRLVDADGSVGKKIVQQLKKQGKQIRYQNKPDKPTKSVKKSAPTTSVAQQQVRPPDAPVIARLLGHHHGHDEHARAMQEHQAFLRAMRQSRQAYQAQKAKEMQKQAQQRKKMQQQQQLAKQRQKQDLKRDMKHLRVKKLASQGKKEELRKQKIQENEKVKREQEKKRKQNEKQQEERKRREQSKKRAEALKKRFGKK